MPLADSPAIVVARFLASSNYKRTLDAFIEETGLPPDAGNVAKGDLTIEKILEEKKLYDLSAEYEKHGLDAEAGWTSPAPAVSSLIELPDQANILHISAGQVGETRETQPEPLPDTIFVTTAARRLFLLEAEANTRLVDSLSPQDSPILSWTSLGGNLSIGTCMSGQVILYDHASKTVVSERRDHKKYVVKGTSFHDEDDGTHWVATAGWDAKVFLYRIPAPAPSTSSSPDTSIRESAVLSAPVTELTLPTNPEDILFYRPPSNPSRLILIVGRRDSTYLHYYAVKGPGTNSAAAAADDSSLVMLGSQNLAPYSTTWSTFSPSALALSPVDPSIVAIATSSIPSLKVIVARLLVPDDDDDNAAQPRAPDTASTAPAPPAAQAHTDPTREDGFNPAILVHAATQAPQNVYSTPRLVWRPDGSGLWVNGDDGVIRGVEARSGRVVATLRGGHDADVKVRDLWAGWVRKSKEKTTTTEEGGEEKEETDDDDDDGREEWLISGGFDQKLVLWRVE